jgi:F-type H+-transporting ATPase subunit gamma
MSATLEEMSRRLNSVNKLSSVVRITKTIAASQIQRCEVAALASQHYALNIAMALYVLFHKGQFGVQRPGRGSPPSVAIVFGTDQGLVGAFNDRLVQYVLGKIHALSDVRVFSFGARASNRLEEAGVVLAKAYPLPSAAGTVAYSIYGVISEIEAVLLNNPDTRVLLFYNHLTSRTAYEPRMSRVLPLDETWKRELLQTPWPTKQIPEIIGDPQKAFVELLREYLMVSFSRTIAETLACENVSRFLSMQRAEKNIDDVKGDLRQSFNLFRQSAIDDELFDVIGGFSALSNELGT